MNAQQHDTEQAKQYFDRWHLYRQIIGNDYMAHQSIHAALRKFVVSRIDKPFSLLDLGCGDASAIAGAFAGTGLQTYTGVDLSPAALGQAAKNLESVSYEVRLVEYDFTAYLAQSGLERYNVILSGFALHHLFPDEKREFFRKCHAALESPGYLLLYDVFRREGETREDYMRAYCRHCSDRWTGLSDDSLSSAIEHIKECDYPETYTTIVMMANEAGFTSEPAPLFVDASQFHCLYGFRA